MKKNEIPIKNYLKYIALILVVILIILFPKKYHFKEIQNNISFNTVCHSTLKIFNNDNCIHQNINIILDDFDNFSFTKTYKIERVREYFDFSGIKDNEIISIRVYENGYLEMKDKYYYIGEDYSLYDKLTNILLK